MLHGRNLCNLKTHFMLLNLKIAHKEKGLTLPPPPLQKRESLQRARKRERASALSQYSDELEPGGCKLPQVCFADCFYLSVSSWEKWKVAKFILGILDPFWDPLPFEQFSNLKNYD